MPLTNPSDKSWLSALKSGDQVVFQEHGWAGIRLVTAVTAKQIAVGEFHRFWKKDGKELGEFARGHLFPATDENLKAVADKEKVTQLRTQLRQITSKLESVASHISPENEDDPEKLEAVLNQLIETYNFWIAPKKPEPA